MDIFWLIVVIIACGLLLFAKVLPLVYYNFKEQIDVDCDLDTAWNAIFIYSKDYDPTYTNLILTNNQPANPQQRRVHTSGVDVVAELIELNAQDHFSQKPLDSETLKPIFGDNSIENYYLEKLDENQTRITVQSYLGFHNPLEGLYLYRSYNTRYLKDLAEALNEGVQKQQTLIFSWPLRYVMLAVFLPLGWYYFYG